MIVITNGARNIGLGYNLCRLDDANTFTLDRIVIENNESYKADEDGCLEGDIDNFSNFIDMKVVITFDNKYSSCEILSVGRFRCIHKIIVFENVVFSAVVR